MCSCVLAVSNGCETVPTAERPPMPDETLDDIRSAEPPATGTIYEVPGESVITADAAAEARVTTVLIPLDRGIDRAWALADEEVVPALTRGVWHGNGLRVGLLPASRLNDFIDALPETWDDRQQRIVAGPTPTPLVRSRPLRAAFYADLTVPPFAPKREEVTGHRLHLLMSVRPQPGGFCRVELTPHHHKPRQMLRPRTAQEKLLDGRLFEELAIRLAVTGDRYLVLGLARDPWTLPPDQRPGAQDPEELPDDAGGGEPVNAVDAGAVDVVLQAQHQDGPAIPPAPTIPLPLNLGRALMTQGVPGGEAQIVMLIRLRPMQ